MEFGHRCPLRRRSALRKSVALHTIACLDRVLTTFSKDIEEDGLVIMVSKLRIGSMLQQQPDDAG